MIIKMIKCEYCGLMLTKRDYKYDNISDDGKSHPLCVESFQMLYSKKKL
jgi:hypothetical protein